MKPASKSILIIDGDEQRARGLSILLKSTLGPEYNVLCSATAEKALLVLSLKNFHLAIVDSGMACLGGVWLCQQIYNQHPGTLVLAISFIAGESNVGKQLSAIARGSFGGTRGVSELLTVISAALKLREQVMKGQFPGQPWQGRVMDYCTLQGQLLEDTGKSAPVERDEEDKNETDSLLRLEEILYGSATASGQR